MGHQGHRDHKDAAPTSVTLALLTVSDTRTEATDESGRLCAEMAEAAGHTIASRAIVPDDPSRVRLALQTILADARVEAVLVNGGTGISGRDRTYEAVSALLDARLDGFGELFRALSYQQIGSAAMLSRAVAGSARGRAVFCMPGSPAAVRLALEKLVLPELSHVVAELRRTT
ncbi:MAG: MogA/MoaB family molybdenum cofactor biosynthesis protein [Candidatus Polarisedimenticolia bacterium]